MEHQHHQKPNGVQMLQGVQRQAAPTFGSVVPQLVGHKTMAQLMKRDAQQRWDKPKKDAENIGKIKSIPNGLQSLDGAHPLNW